MKTLTPNDKHLLRLVERGKKENGWSNVSAQVWPFISKLPQELVELKEVGFGGIVKLTKEGEIVLKWL